jgi:hypothetical protein
MTTNAGAMWLGSVPEEGHVEVEIIIPSDVTLGSIKIWNYNKSLIDSVKGVKDIHITLTK